MSIPLREVAQQVDAEGSVQISMYHSTIPEVHGPDGIDRQWVARPSWHRHIRLLPDGRTDLVWDGRELVAHGPTSAAIRYPVAGREPIVGIRMRIGAARALFSCPLHRVLNRRAAFSAVAPRSPRTLERALRAAKYTTQRQRMLLEFVAELNLTGGSEASLVVETARLLDGPTTTVSSIASRLGIPDRRLHQVCRLELGFGPKVLQQILRFNRFLAILPEISPKSGWGASVAMDLGYADQAHFCRETRRLALSTPMRLARTSQAFTPPI